MLASAVPSVNAHVDLRETLGRALSCRCQASEDSEAWSSRASTLSGNWNRRASYERHKMSLGELIRTNEQFSQIDNTHLFNRKSLSKIPNDWPCEKVYRLELMDIRSNSDLQKLWNAVSRISTVTALGKIAVAQLDQEPHISLLRIAQIYRGQREILDQVSQLISTSDCERQSLVAKRAVFSQLIDMLESDAYNSAFSESDLNTRVGFVAERIIGSVNCDRVYGLANAVLNIFEVELFPAQPSQLASLTHSSRQPRRSSPMLRLRSI